MGEPPVPPHRDPGAGPSDDARPPFSRLRGPRSSAVVPDDRWATGDTALRLLLNGRRRWEHGPRPEARAAEMHGAEMCGAEMRGAEMHGAEMHGAEVGRGDGPSGRGWVSGR